MNIFIILYEIISDGWTKPRVIGFEVPLWIRFLRYVRRDALKEAGAGLA